MQATLQHQQHTLSIRTAGKSLHPLTGDIQQLVGASGIQVGLCHLFVCHTSASLLIQENADPDVLRDLESFFAQLVPEDLSRYRHRAEGMDDMPAHIRSALTHTSETIPIRAGQLALGTWQGIYLWEHRQRGHLRQVVVHLTGY
ncbi:MAG: secondary thiamine-phosphate synthase enzyme YjbQ [Thermostichus sp. DG_1_6_bins_120]